MLPRLITVTAFLALIAGVAGCGGDGLYRYEYADADGGTQTTVLIAKPPWWDNPGVLYCDDPKVQAEDYAGTGVELVDGIGDDGVTPETWPNTLDRLCRVSGP